MRYFLLACFILSIIILPAHGQNTSIHQKEIEKKLKEINNLSKTGNLQEAVKKAETVKTLIYDDPESTNYQKYRILFSLNFLYRYLNDDNNEFKTYIELNKIREKEIETERNYFQNSLTELLAFYKKTKNKKNIPLQFKKINTSLKSHLKKALDKRFIDEKTKFLENNITPYFDLFQSFAYSTNYKYSYFNHTLLNNTLLTKGALLNSSKNIIQRLQASNNDTILKKIKNYRFEKAFVSLQLSLKESQRHKSFKHRQERLKGFEQELIALYQTLPEKKKDNILDWRRIPLKESEIAIEFTRFKFYNKKWTDSILYVAQIFKGNSKSPTILPLFEEKELTSIINKKTASEIYNSRGSKSTSTSTAANANALYNLIIKPFESYLKGHKHIYFSPDGILHQIAFSALKTNENKRLIESFNLTQVTSTLTIKRSKTEPRTKSAALFGGIDYSYKTPNDIEPSLKNESYLQLETFRNIKSTTDRNEIWPFLEGTKTEIDGISSIFKNADKSCFIFSNKDASEENFKMISGKSPNILHIATHGFFFEDIKQKKNKLAYNQYKVSEEPLLRSGLILANANYAWLNGNNPFEDEDGILSALEISNLDLSNTDMVVLSACETGLGDIEGSEGVYGLQRAFKMAGVDLIIMSLWEVPDAETSEFMTIFYTNWLNGQEVKTAFRNTQLTMAKKYKDNPEKWAAFVLFE